MHDKRFPNESDDYRVARAALLKAELELDEKVQQVAALRAQLPLGGRVEHDYEFAGADGPVKLSELFAPGKDSLVIYSYMYAASAERPCPMCTSLLDGFNGAADHITDRINLAVVARSPIDRIQAVAGDRGWTKLRLLSSAGNTYNEDYLGETDKGQQPAINVFVRRPDGIHHYWHSELLWVDRGSQPRHADQMWPIWHLFDLTPEGRGADWYPKLSY